MKNEGNLQKLQTAYTAWHETKGDSKSQWLDLMDDEILISNVGEEADGLSFARDRRSKVEAADYIAAIVKEWSMIHWTCDNYVADEDSVAMFGRCAWTNRKTGKTAEVRVAHLWRFRGGKAVEYTEIFDSARAAAAAT